MEENKGVTFRSLLPDPKTGKIVYFTVTEDVAQKIRDNPKYKDLLVEEKEN